MIKEWKKYLIGFLGILFILTTIYTLRFFNSSKTIISGDGHGYYAFLPSIFIYHDLANPNLDLYDPDREWLEYHIFHQVENGNYIDKYPIGLAILWLPFFLLAYFISHFYYLPVDGYNYIFQYLIGFSALIYLSGGLITLLIILRDKLKLQLLPAIFTILAIFWGTNLFNYGWAQIAMSHVYSFFLLSVILYLIISWRHKPSFKLSLFLGLAMGLFTLVRLSNFLVILLWLLYGIWSRKSLVQTFQFWQKYLVYSIIVLLSMLCLLSLQGVYYYFITGKLCYFAYQGEYFNWLNPAWYGVLFSFRRGLFLWTPIISLAFLGLLQLKKMKQWFFGSLLFLGLETYLIAAWHSWWYGDSFGHRAFVDYYPLVALWMGQAIATLWNSKFKMILIIIIILLIFINLYLVDRYWKGLLPQDNITSQIFWQQFGLKLD